MTAAALGLLALACVAGAWRFTTARWAYRAPRTAILLWQALGVTWGLASTGALLSYALQPYDRGIVGGLAAFAYSAASGGYGPPGAYDMPHVLALIAGLSLLAVLVGVLVTAGFQTLRARRRHREMLALIARDDPGVPGVRVLDHPGAAAYCVPGLRSQVVISAGTLKLLSPTSWPPSWRTRPPTYASATTWCCSRSPPCAARCRGPRSSATRRTPSAC
ncbi:M48 family metalloprotease [Thermocatellispora tengchongensis]|uniref:hypothetical protein n=1 Tax=Thermocatellispora tengchongensis TaxID=1073253 RepID=UPI0036372A7D